MTTSREAQAWIDSAERDRDAARILTGASHPPYEIIAFHCQQCAEKYLKALFVLHNRKLPFVHDLLKLNRDIQDQCQNLSGVETECERLTPFGTVARYPGSIMEPGPEHM